MANLNNQEEVPQSNQKNAQNTNNIDSKPKSDPGNSIPAKENQSSGKPRNNRNQYKRRRYTTPRNKSARAPKSKLSFRKVSILIPLFNEYESLTPLYNKIRDAVKPINIDHEIIFVDDGSTDESLKVIKSLAKRDQKVKYISFRKNYGKSAALQVGFEAVKGDAVITMDADLQDDPAEIPNLLYKLDEGFDLVSGWKKKRFDPFIKRHSSKFFNWITGVMSGIRIHDFNCGLKAYRTEVVKSVNVHGELHRYIPVLADWQGFSVSEIVVKHHPRRYGKTKFGLSRFFKGFVDLITVIFSTRYIKRPMHLFGFLGTLSFLAGFGISAYLSYEWWFRGLALSNRPLLFLGMLLIIVGVQFFSTGLLGEMIVHNTKSSEEYSIKERK